MEFEGGSFYDRAQRTAHFAALCPIGNARPERATLPERKFAQVRTHGRCRGGARPVRTRTDPLSACLKNRYVPS
jgi:hypothetical protein